MTNIRTSGGTGAYKTPEGVTVHTCEKCGVRFYTWWLTKRQPRGVNVGVIVQRWCPDCCNVPKNCQTDNWKYDDGAYKID